VLSLYLDVNPANPDNTPKAFVLRAAEAMRGIDLDKGYIREVTTRLAERFVIAEGRSLVIFAGEDLEQLFNAYYLQSRLPLLNLNDGALAYWGKPLTAPLLYTLDQKERYAVIYASSDRVRVFEAFLGQIEEISDYVRLVDSDSWQPYRHARRSPLVGAGVAARGGADVDSYQDRMEEATARLYRTLLPQVEVSLKEEEVDRIILIGLPDSLTAFQESMSTAMRQRVVGTLPPPANPDGPPLDWLPLVVDLIAEAEAEHEMDLLDRIRETGVSGLQETLSMLQERRIHTLVLPFTLTQRVYRAEGGRVAASAEEARVLSPGEVVDEVALLEVVPDLVTQTGVTIEFVNGEAEARLVKEFGGLAGLKRW